MMVKKRILLLEDELIISKHIQLLLMAHGYEISCSNNVSDCIRQIDQFHPHLVILDINLSGGTEGFEVGHYLLKKDLAPFIYLTSYSDKKTVSLVKETRPMGYIVKPFRSEDILTTVEITINNYNYRRIDVSRSAQNDPVSEAPYKIKKVVAYINDNLFKPVKVVELAAISGWDRAHFTKLFKKYMQISPYQYILQQKIGRAKELIDQDSTISITDLSSRLGFESHSNFVNAFQKFHSMTAENYRKLTRTHL